MLFNPRYGVIGMITYPFFFFGEMLAPVVELFGYFLVVMSLLTGEFDAAVTLLFLGVSVGFGTLLSYWAVLLEQLTFRRYTDANDIWRMLGFAMLENVGYRQATAWWRLKAFVNVARGDRGWGTMVREGFRSGEEMRALTPVTAMSAVETTPAANESDRRVA
jgi:hypothetical protein